MSKQRCALASVGCGSPGTIRVGVYYLCKKHYQQGLAVCEKMRVLTLLYRIFDTEGLESCGHSHSHGWRPYYRLDDMSPWQENALRCWEDADDSLSA